MKQLFALHGPVPQKQKTAILLAGLGFIVFVWWFLVASGFVQTSILPSPVSTLAALPELHFEDYLLRNLGYSIRLNLSGYMEAVIISLPIGFAIGLVPLFRGMFHLPFNGLRYLPIAAVVGLFIMWFGLGSAMKVQFLALGIIVYLVPVIVERIDEVPKVYLDTVTTLGANWWQMVRHVYLPSVLSRVFIDMMVLVPISWTYIIVAEVVNQGDGGIGALIWIARRQTRPDKVFALLMVIMLVGFLQDRIFRLVHRLLFRFVYAKGGRS